MIRRHRDPLLAFALLVGSVVELLVRPEADALAFIAAALITVPVAVRRRWPWGAYAGVAAGFTLLAAAGREPDATAEIVALWAVVYTFGALPRRRDALMGLALIGVPLALSVAVSDPPEVIWVLGVFVLPPWITGRLMQLRQQRIRELRQIHGELERERERSALLAAQLERARLARDIQLILADALARIRDLAEVGRRDVEDDHDDAARTFEEIRAAGTQATAELRRLLGVLRGDAAPSRPGRA